MAQYKWANADVTSSSPTVKLVGVDATAEIDAGDEFIVVGNGIPYVVNATPTLSGSDTLVTLSTTYAGTTATGVSVTFQRDYTTDGIPILSEGDVETGTIAGRLASIVQSLLSSILAGTTPFSDPAAVRTQLVAGGLHKTNSRPATADLNAGDKWADIDYGTNVCAIYCIVDPATPALDSLEAFVATADGKWLPLDNSEPTAIDCSAGGTVTLTALQNAYGVYNLTGTPAAAFNLVVSTTKRTFTVSNASGQTVTVKTSGGTGINVTDGMVMLLRCDGTNVVNDNAGSGELTSTSLSNSWAGTAYYERSASGTTRLKISVTTVGTTTNGTVIFTMPAGYRPNLEIRVTLTSPSVTGGVAGFLLMGPDGQVKIYEYIAGGTSISSEWFNYVARN